MKAPPTSATCRHLSARSSPPFPQKNSPSAERFHSAERLFFYFVFYSVTACTVKALVYRKLHSVALLTICTVISPISAYAVGFAGLGSLSTMTFIRLSVHLIGSANLASPITASLASSAGFSTPPRTSSTTAYL